MGACGLAALLQAVTRQQDKKVAARLWEAARKLPGAAVVWPSGLLWLPEVFLVKLGDPEAVSSQEKKQQAALEAARKAWLVGRLPALQVEHQMIQYVS